MMRKNGEVKQCTKKIGDLLRTRPDLELLVDRDEVATLKTTVGLRELVGFDGFLVKSTKGEFTEIYGFKGKCDPESSVVCISEVGGDQTCNCGGA